MRVPVCVNADIMIFYVHSNGRVNAHIFKIYQANLKRWLQGPCQCGQIAIIA
ncbi:hypothetical protein C4K00_1384 [Pseudomonas synxantha]|nr:hypothetical protein C4K00_1384 [Pseudomonas synxantha]AZE77195.1 hypothetical protein C4J99_1394 [Pseudomonas synxantha]